ncbi:MAG: MBL fold metallo-hydrolase [Ignavibacteriae bacterium]|nr:MBL fold metallo-hydrolase [Ignavibacteria bacterium]MBI3365021.1 MBL fold metallo-hydrolase [Ignavibacteriota bacterium]
MLFANDVTEPAPVRPDPKQWDNSTITAAWIGHATVLINFFGTKIITDPVFSQKIGINLLGLATLGPQRLVEPALRIDELPPVDLILLSHAHMDHLDFPSLRKFNKNISVVMAKNTSDLLFGRGWKDVRELDWGETVTLKGVTIEALKVRHFGWRFPWEKDRSRGEWNGRSFNAYLLSKNGKHIVFGGDTAYQEFFTSLADRNIPIDLAILPIGAYDPWIHVHANPEQAVAMANHMKAKAILPIHWNTFTLSFEPQREPIERLKRALAQHSPTLALDDVGQTWRLTS